MSKATKSEPATFSGTKKTFGDDDSDLDLEATTDELEAADQEKEAGMTTRKRKGSDSAQQDEDGDEDAPEEGGVDEAEMQRLRAMFDQHAPKEGTKKKKKKRKPKPVEEVDPKDMLDASVLEDIDADEVDAHRGIIDADGDARDSEDDENEDEGKEKGKNGGLKIDKNKRGSKIIGDLQVKVLGKESPVKMMIKSSRGGSTKMNDLLGSNERESYSVFATQKNRQSARKFVQ